MVTPSQLIVSTILIILATGGGAWFATWPPEWWVALTQ